MTNIEWTDATWNPIRGCSRVSEGCRNCYAEKVAYRFSGPGQPYEGLATKVNGHAAWTAEVRFVEDHLLDPLKWGHVPHHEDTGIKTRGKCECPGRPRRIFVNSMSDLFHENVPDEWIDRIFAVMALCPQHTFQVLTKRPERMLKYLTGLCCGRISDEVAELVEKHWHRDWIKGMPRGFEWNVYGKIRTSGGVGDYWPLPNVWLGVSVENQAAADERIPLLLQTPAGVRFISAEPLLGTVELCRYLGFQHEDEIGIENVDQSLHEARALGMHDPWVRGLDWVICGGESGPGARPMHPDWARSLRDQCQAAGVPFFFKQWGEYGALFPKSGVPLSDADKLHVWGDGVSSFRFGKKAAGALLDGREWREFPEVRP
jgi:protein gp37